MFLALSGAFTSTAVPLTLRFAYWIPVMLLGAVVGRMTAALVSRIPRATSNEWLYGALLALAITVPATLVIWAYTSVFFHQPIALEALPFFAGPVLLVSVGMTAIMMLVGRPGRMTHGRAITPTAPSVATPRFYDRLPPKLKGALIYAVQAEDHYLRLHTSKGSDLILMRMADAIAELDGIEGAQTHRSWWVAKDGFEGAAREGDRLLLNIKDGVKAPVSRPNVRALREAGWF